MAFGGCGTHLAEQMVLITKYHDVVQNALCDVAEVCLRLLSYQMLQISVWLSIKELVDVISYHLYRIFKHEETLKCLEGQSPRNEKLFTPHQELDGIFQIHFGILFDYEREKR